MKKFLGLICALVMVSFAAAQQENRVAEQVTPQFDRFAEAEPAKTQPQKPAEPKAASSVSVSGADEIIEMDRMRRLISRIVGVDSLRLEIRNPTGP